MRGINIPRVELAGVNVLLVLNDASYFRLIKITQDTGNKYYYLKYRIIQTLHAGI